MYLSDGGYSDVQFDAALLRNKAHEIASVLPIVMRETGAQAVAVTGKSGLSLAFATLMLINFPLIVVRKRGENSHGNPIEGTTGIEIRKYVILDDFVSSGATIKTIIGSIEELNACNRSERTVRCVGVLQYLRYGTGYSPMHYRNHTLNYKVPVYSMAFEEEGVRTFNDFPTE